MMVPNDVTLARLCASAEPVYRAGESGPVWQVVEGLVHLGPDGGVAGQPAQIALPGDLVGVEALCGLRYHFSATAFTACRLVPLPLDEGAPRGLREALLRQTVLQQQARSQDMVTLRSGPVLARLAHLLRLLGWGGQVLEAMPSEQADAIRRALPALRVVAQVVDVKTETVCRALARLLPPRSRKPGPVRTVALPGTPFLAGAAV